MNWMRKSSVCLCGWAALSGATPSSDVAGTGVNVTPAPSHLLQRVELPAAILAAAQTTGLGDLRLLDADGRAVPIAPADPIVALRRDALRPLPILATDDTLRVTALSLRLDEAGQPRLATVAGTPVQASGAHMIGILLDARGLAGEATRLLINAQLPPGQPVTFVAEASANLTTWRPLGEATAYRESENAATQVVLPLGGGFIEGDYLRLSWKSDSRLLARVAVQGAMLERRDTARTVTVAAEAPAPAKDGSIQFSMPFATPLVSLRVITRGGERAVPVRILGRDEDAQPWTVLGAGIATAASTVPLVGASARIIRIEPSSGGGFAAAPGIAFGLAPRAILFVPSGRPPYILAISSSATVDPALSRASFGPDLGEPGTAIATSPAVRLQLLAPGNGGRRRLVLWGLLLFAVAALAAMAWLIWRQSTVAEPVS